MHTQLEEEQESGNLANEPCCPYRKLLTFGRLAIATYTVLTDHTPWLAIPNLRAVTTLALRNR